MHHVQKETALDMNKKSSFERLISLPTFKTINILSKKETRFEDA